MSNPITISPNIQSGEPVFTNTRVPLKNLFDYLKTGHTLNDFLKDFPSVKKDQAIEVLNHFESYLNSLSRQEDDFEISPFVKSISSGKSISAGLDYKKEREEYIDFLKKKYQ